MIKLRKILKKKKQWRDYKKRENILRQWQREQQNRQGAGLPLKRMPVDFPKSRKWTPAKRRVNK